MAGLATVISIVSTLTNCSAADARDASEAICQSPDALAIMETACGVSTAMTAAGGVGALVGLGTGALPLAAGSAGVGAVGALGARRFCNAAIDQVTNAVGNAASASAISPNATTMFRAYYPASGGGAEE